MSRWLLVLWMLAALDARAGDAPRLEIGQDAPQFSLKTMNEKKSSMTQFVLRDFVGESAKEKKRAVVLSFAASYCEPCKKELAELKKLKAKLDASNVLVAVVVIDTEPEGIEKMRALTVDELALEFPVLTDRFGVLARRYYANTLPMTVIVKPDGKIQWLNSGFQDDAIDKLLGQLAIAK
jgi:alkyl hydroperoxide reductase subunit AhpC